MNPDDLLQQIGELVGQYLQAAPDSPLAAEMRGIAEAIATGANPEAMEPGPEAGLLDPSAPADDTLPQQEGLDLEEPPPGTSKTFEGARATAEERLKKRNQQTRA